jgi:hypothetical protein
LGLFFSLCVQLTNPFLPVDYFGKAMEMAAAKAASGVVVSRPLTFVTGNAKKLEEVRAILGQTVPFQSLKLDRTISLYTYPCLSVENIKFMLLGLIVVGVYSTRSARRT